KKGMETIQTTAHRKIPKHVIPLWQDPKYCLKMQRLAINKSLMNQTNFEQFLEVSRAIAQLQYKYKSNTVSESIKDNLAIVDPSEYYNWCALERKKDKLLKKMEDDS